jgi:SAM-dependent methyltransferase
MLQLTRLNSRDDYLAYFDASAATRLQRQDEERELIRDSELFSVSGRCYACERARDFAVRFTREERESQDAPNWREHLWCPGCRLNARLRACFHLFETICAGDFSGSIYLPEQRSPFYTKLRSRFPSVVGSEFLGPSFKAGQRNWRGIRHEDLSELSFPDGIFDAILCFEILEHVPDYSTALRECIRCLKTPGLFMFTAPFILDAEDNVIRARRGKDGSIEQVLPPEYHSDPFGKKQILCFRHFGWQLLEEMSELGFSDVHALLYWSRHYGYLGQESVVFFARK